MKKLFITALAAAAFSLNIAAKSSNQNNVLSVKESIEDSHIVFPESFEQNTQKLLESWYNLQYTEDDLNKMNSRTDPGASPEVIKQRLAELQTEIDLPYNQIVQSYIDNYLKGRNSVSAMLGLGTYYMPIFKQALEENGLPLELRYLAVIESGLNPNAVSRSGAAGLWQFIIAAADGYGMEVTSLVDERRDPFISTQKACAFLKDLYNTYGDWSLAIAAYNCGPGTVNKALRKAGGDPNQHDFWSIYNYLPSETRGYVPKFIAANYIMEYYKDHNISPALPDKPVIPEAIPITQRVHFNQISKVLDIPVEEIRILNPQFRQDVIPGTPSHPYNLILPSQQSLAYIMSEDQILAYDRDKYARRTEATPGGKPGDEVNFDNELNDPYNPADLALAGEDDTTIVEEALPETTTKPRRRGNRGETSTPTTTATENVASQQNNNTESGTTSRRERREQAKSTVDPTATSTPSTPSTTTNQQTAQSSSQSGTATNRRHRNQETGKAQTAQTTQTSTATAKPKQEKQPAKTQTKQQTAQAKQQTTQSKQTAQTTSKQKGKQQAATVTTKQQTAQATTTSGKKGAKQQETAQTGKKGAKQETAQTGKKGAKQQETAQTGKKGAKQETAQTGKKGAKQETAKTQTKQQPKQQASTASKNKQHEVASGDNLEKIAKRNGMTVAELKKQNPQIKDPNKIRPGDKINVNKPKQKPAETKKAEPKKTETKPAQNKQAKSTTKTSSGNKGTGKKK